MKRRGSVMGKRLAAIAGVVILLTVIAAPQEKSTPGMAMSSQDMPDMPSIGNDGSAHAMHSMEHRHMDMGPHMKMTTLRELRPGDQEKADRVLAAAGASAEKYKDYRSALADGY